MALVELELVYRCRSLPLLTDDKEDKVNTGSLKKKKAKNTDVSDISKEVSDEIATKSIGNSVGMRWCFTVKVVLTRSILTKAANSQSHNYGHFQRSYWAITRASRLSACQGSKGMVC